MIADDRAQLPALPTRQDVADFCNRHGAWPKPITARSVQYWEHQGLLPRHPAYRNPARYSADKVVAFLKGEF